MPRDKSGRFSKQEPEPEFVPEDYTVEQVTALNMERAARLVTNGVPPGTPTPAARITSGPMTAPPMTMTGGNVQNVTLHVPPIIPELTEPTAEDYAAVLDPEISEELRKLGLHPEQIAPVIAEVRAETAAAPVDVQAPSAQPIAPFQPQLPIAALLTWAAGGSLKLTRLVGHAPTRSWPIGTVATSSRVLADILAAFGVTVVDLTDDAETEAA